MYPMGWDDGPPAPRDTFEQFMKFSDEAREYALLHAKGKSYHEIFELLRAEHQAANDNRSDVGDQAVAILMSLDYLNMNACWVQCHKDMVLTKLTYDASTHYTLEY
jgi:hypothetical protein